MDHSYPYIASLTREPFIFYEMRSTAKLMAEGNSDDAVVKEIVERNFLQYPTEKSITRMAKACIKRLHALEDDLLVSAIVDLEQRISNASTGERVKLNKKLTTLQAQDTEIRTYEEKIHYLADQMIFIDLDDDVKKNYAIF